MSTNALPNAKYKDLGETWYCYQAARIVQRHMQFGQHCRLDLEDLLTKCAGSSARISTARPTSIGGD
jgi:hypothetical protein